ncbi:protein of unknown function [Paraburkholderia kururiensis]
MEFDLTLNHPYFSISQKDIWASSVVHANMANYPQYRLVGLSYTLSPYEGTDTAPGCDEDGCPACMRRKAPAP